MERFVLSDALGKILAAAGITKSRTEDIAREVSAQFPDLEEARVEFERRVRAELEPSLNVETITGLIAGGWAELKSGHPGSDKHHLGGA